MLNTLNKLFMLFCVTTLFLVLSGTAMAQDAAPDDLDIDALIMQYLPDGVNLDTATDQQIIDAVSQACAAFPDASPQITARSVQARPNLAAAIVAAAIQAAPDQAAQIQAAADQTLRQLAAQQAILQAQQQALQETTAPDMRDDAPASPVR